MNGLTPTFHIELLTLLIEELPLDDVVVLLDVLVVPGLVEEDEEGQTLLRELLGVLEGDLPDERRALVGGEDGELVVVVEVALERLVVLVGARLVRAERHDRLPRGVHRGHGLEEQTVDLINEMLGKGAFYMSRGGQMRMEFCSSSFCYSE